MNKRASTHLLQRRNKTTYITWKARAHLLCAPCRRIYRGGRRHHVDMSVVVPINLSCRPRVLPGHKDTWNISTTDIAAGTDTDFVGACTPALRLTCRWFDFLLRNDPWPQAHVLTMPPRIFSWILVPACVIVLWTSGTLTSSSKSLRRWIIQCTVNQSRSYARTFHKAGNVFPIKWTMTPKSVRCSLPFYEHLCSIVSGIEIYRLIIPS